MSTERKKKEYRQAKQPEMELCLFAAVLHCTPAQATEQLNDVSGQLPKILSTDTAKAAIQSYLDNDLNMTMAARKSYMHRNTIEYYIARIKKRTGVDVKTFRGALLCAMAFAYASQRKEKA